MIGDNHEGPGLVTLVRKTMATGFGLLENRGELLMVELQEEKSRLIQLLIRGLGGLFLAVLTAVLLTATVIFLVPPEYRVYAAGGFTVMYLAGTIWALVSLKSLLKRIPFSESLAQIKKDRELVEVFND